MREGICCRIKFYFLLALFFAPVGMGEWRSRVIAETERPQFTEPIPELRDYCLQAEQQDRDATRLADLDLDDIDDDVPTARP